MDDGYCEDIVFEDCRTTTREFRLEWHTLVPSTTGSKDALGGRTGSAASKKEKEEEGVCPRWTVAVAVAVLCM